MSDFDFMAASDTRQATRAKTESKREGEKPRVKAYCIQLPIETHRALKAAAAERGMSIGELTDLAVKAYINI